MGESIKKKTIVELDDFASVWYFNSLVVVVSIQVSFENCQRSRESREV